MAGCYLLSPRRCVSLQVECVVPLEADPNPALYTEGSGRASLPEPPRLRGWPVSTAASGAGPSAPISVPISAQGLYCQTSLLTVSQQVSVG